MSNRMQSRFEKRSKLGWMTAAIDAEVAGRIKEECSEAEELTG